MLIAHGAEKTVASLVGSQCAAGAGGLWKVWPVYKKLCKNCLASERWDLRRFSAITVQCKWKVELRYWRTFFSFKFRLECWEVLGLTRMFSE